MSTLLKYSIAVIAGLLVVFFSIDINKTNQNTKATEKFDAVAYTADLWEKEMPAVAEKAPIISELLDALLTDPEHAVSANGYKLGISKTVYFFAKGTGIVESLDEENMWVTLVNGSRIRIATDFIFGNAVRDGSGIVNIDDFLNMTDFNNVSVALNKLVKNNVVSGLKTEAKPAMRIDFAGAFELNETRVDLTAIRMIPVVATLNPGPHE
jgi:predicted lipoprotein